MDYIVGLNQQATNRGLGWLSACFAALVALTGCNVTSSIELHHEDALSVFEYAAADSDTYVEVVGNPTGADKAALTNSVLEKFDQNW